MYCRFQAKGTPLLSEQPAGRQCHAREAGLRSNLVLGKPLSSRDLCKEPAFEFLGRRVSPARSVINTSAGVGDCATPSERKADVSTGEGAPLPPGSFPGFLLPLGGFGQAGAPAVSSCNRRDSPAVARTQVVDPARLGSNVEVERSASPQLLPVDASPHEFDFAESCRRLVV